MNVEVIVLRLIHVLGGMFWVGTALFNSFFLLPAAASAGAAAGPVLAGLQQRRLFTVLPIVALLTILSGLRLIWIMGGGGAYFQTTMGRVFSLGGALAIVGFAYGMIFVRPLGPRMATLGTALAAASDDATRARLGAELAGTRRRMAVGNVIATSLVVLAAAAMAIARHLP